MNPSGGRNDYDILLFTHDGDAARREIGAAGGRVVFDFGGAVVARVPGSADPGGFRTCRVSAPASIDDRLRLLAGAWELSSTILAHEPTSPEARLTRACVSEPVPRAQPGETFAAVRGLRGRIAVVLLTVTGPGPMGMSPAETMTVLAEALAALNFLSTQNPVAAIEFLIDQRHVGVQSTPCAGQSCISFEDCEGWLFDAMGMLGFARDRSGVEALAQKALVDKRADSSFVGAFTRYKVCHFAYAEPALSFTVIGYTTAPMTIGQIHNFFAHEVSHLYESSDEYNDPGTPLCGDVFGELSVPNHNSSLCGWAPHTCMMQFNAPLAICEFTRWQIGWNNRSMPRQVIGPSGGRGGGDVALPFALDALIREIRVFSGKYIDSLHVVADVPSAGRVTQSAGGPGGGVSILLLDPDERIVAVSGRHGDYIDSLTIHTDKRGAALSVGGPGGTTDFRYDVPQDKQLSGLVCRSGAYIDALGVILDPRAVSATPGLVRRCGSSGGWGGGLFDDPAPAGGRVTKIRIRHGKYIDAVGLSYDVGGTPVDSPMRGGPGGALDEFILMPGEFIVGIAGRYGEFVDSLIVQTNRRFSRRFGGTGGAVRFDHVYWPNEEVIGLFGHSGLYVDSIGCTVARRS